MRLWWRMPPRRTFEYRHARRLYPIAQAVIYLAIAPKSNSVGAFWEVQDEITRMEQVSFHYLMMPIDASGLARRGRNIRILFEGHWVQ